MKIDISSLTYDKLNSELGLLGLPKFRTSQIYSWLHKYGCASFDEMTNISKDLREKLSEKYYISSCRIEDKYVSKLSSGSPIPIKTICEILIFKSFCAL